jgi:hypothetical protein
VGAAAVAFVAVLAIRELPLRTTFGPVPAAGEAQAGPAAAGDVPVPAGSGASTTGAAASTVAPSIPEVSR